MMKLLKKTVDVFSSFGFASILLLLLLLLTYLGTLEQVDSGLYDVQKKYFESVFLFHDFHFGSVTIPVPLPGVYLLLLLLFLNLVIGGILRIRKTWSKAGILTVHVGIIVMLVAGFVKLRYSTDGHLTLYENQRSSEYESYFEWELCVATDQGDQVREYLIAAEEFMGLADNQSLTYQHAELPFDVTVTRHFRNCRVLPKGPMFEAPTPVIDGVFLEPRESELEAEMNIAGAYVQLLEKATGARHDGLLFGLNLHPYSVVVAGRLYSVDLRKKRWPLPFEIHLDKFTRELHPGTQMDKVFLSDVTKIEDGVSRQLKITMNEPLRHAGYTLFQAKWGPSNARPGDPLFSTFAVVRNPSDQWPLYSCIIIAAGLLFHFGLKLSKYIQSENKRRLA